jgi:phosphatidylglycerol:prolipoprotein diacylglycerol transferase
VYPILFVFSGIPIYASPVFLALALLTGFFVGRHEILRRGISLKVFYLFWIVATPTALLLAAANSALFYGRSFNILAHPGELTSSGLVSFGAVIASLGAGFILARAYQLSPGEIMDVIAIILPLILGVYRIGCILNGCCYGLETDGFFGVYLPNISGAWARRYPTQILLLVFDLALFFVLWKWRLKDPPDGKTTLVFLLSFSIFRLLLDGLRELPMVNEWLNILQLGSLTLLLLSIYALIMIRLRRKSPKE